MMRSSDELTRLRLEFFEKYQWQRPQLDRLLAQMVAFFEELRNSMLTDPIHRIHSVRGRVKTPESLWGKCEKKLLKGRHDLSTGDAVYAAAVHRFSDVVGVRVVCNTLEGKLAAGDALRAYAPTSRSADVFVLLKPEDKYYEDTGYRSIHFDARLKPTAWPTLAINTKDGDEHIGIEVQIRTILEEAWGEIQHDIGYKPEVQSTEGTEDRKLTFVALSHRLHAADLHVQRLARLIAKQDPHPTRRPSTGRSIPTAVAHIPRIEPTIVPPLTEHLHGVEDLRTKGDHDEAIRRHVAFREANPGMSVMACATLACELGFDHLKRAEGQRARRLSADEDLDAALGQYAAALQEFPQERVLYWRRARVYWLAERVDDAVRDLEYAKELADHPSTRYLGGTFYRSCLDRMLAALKWPAVEDPPTEAQLRQQDAALAHAKHAAELQLESYRGETKAVDGDSRDASEDCMLHLRDALSKYAWILIEHPRQRDVTRASQQIETLCRHVAPSLWEHDIFLLSTMLRLEVDTLENPLSCDIGRLAKADALRTQLLHALDQQDEYVPAKDVRAMFATFARLDSVWQRYLLT